MPLLLSLSLLLSGCQNTDEASSSSTPAPADTEPVSVIDPSDLFSDRDLDGSYDESTAIPIQLTGETAVCTSDAVSIDGTQITLLDEGTYLVSGSLTDGQIVVDADDTDKVQIVLAGAAITCADSAAIYSKNADKVFLTLAEGTENTLTNGGSYTAIDENNIDAVVFSKTDLTLNGSGNLTIDAQAGHGVVSKDELTIAGGSYAISNAFDEYPLAVKLHLADLEATYLVEKGLVDCLKGAVKSSPPGQLCKDFQNSSPVRAATALHVPLHVLRHHIVDATVEQGTGLPGDSRQIRQPFHA